VTRIDRSVDPGRYEVVPRTLTFLTRKEAVLLLKGASDKPHFAGLYNGVGGHVERDEDVSAAARREVVEETGLDPERLELRGIVHVLPETAGSRGILLFVFRGIAGEGRVVRSAEGQAEWVERDAWDRLPLVEDLPLLLPRVLDASSDAPPFFALYDRAADGGLDARFTP
jgi:8-oxo-dGTP diphosphatase